jgi:hypothetical protein
VLASRGRIGVAAFRRGTAGHPAACGQKPHISLDSAKRLLKTLQDAMLCGMHSANIILSYVKVIVWPAVAVFTFWLFRKQLRTLILSAKKLTAFGAEAEFDDLEGRIRKTESQLGQSSSELEGSSSPLEDKEVRKGQESIAVLSYVELEDIISLDPIQAAVECTQRLQAAINEILKHFGVPQNLANPENAGDIMAKITDVSQWSDYLPLVNELDRATDVLSALQSGPRWLHIVNDQGFDANVVYLRDSAEKITSAVYRLSRVLPALMSRSLKSVSGKPVHSLSVAIYVDGESDNMKSVLDRVDKLVEVLGYGEHISEINERGSWFRRFTAALRSDISITIAVSAQAQAERALELAYIDQHHADVDQATSQALLQVLKSLDNIPIACIRVGSLLIVKSQARNGPSIIARTLSHREMLILDLNPEIIRAPDRIFERLENGIGGISSDELS